MPDRRTAAIALPPASPRGISPLGSGRKRSKPAPPRIVAKRVPVQYACPFTRPDKEHEKQRSACPATQPGDLSPCVAPAPTALTSSVLSVSCCFGSKRHSGLARSAPRPQAQNPCSRSLPCGCLPIQLSAVPETVTHSKNRRGIQGVRPC